MTEKQAIENLKCFPDLNVDDGWITDSEMQELSDMAISALEKQIPKKYEIKDGVPYCPCCGEIATTNTGDSFLDYWLRFCNECGQRLGSDTD